MKPKAEKKIVTRQKNEWRILSKAVEEKQTGNHKSNGSYGKKKYKESCTYSLLDDDDDDSNVHKTPKYVSFLLFLLLCVDAWSPMAVYSSQLLSLAGSGLGKNIHHRVQSAVRYLLLTARIIYCIFCTQSLYPSRNILQHCYLSVAFLWLI